MLEVLHDVRADLEATDLNGMTALPGCTWHSLGHGMSRTKIRHQIFGTI